MCYVNLANFGTTHKNLVNVGVRGRWRKDLRIESALAEFLGFSHFSKIKYKKMKYLHGIFSLL